MAGGISGGWKSRRLFVDYPTPLGRPEQAALHESPDHLEPGSRPPYAAPRLQPAPPTVEDPGTAYDPVWPSQAPGLVLDHERITHDGDGGAGGGQSLYAAQAAGNAARSRDLGAAARQLHEEPVERARDETYATERLTVAPVSAGSRVATLRGRNSLPENNPDGFRPGIRVQRWVNRRIWLRHRRHDLRPLAPLVAAAAVDSPALEEGNRYTSPFGWMQRARKRHVISPMQRRNPRDWDEAVTTDGVTDSGDIATAVDPAYQVWGL
ncbi:hypothetical protein E1265_21350 [Streptomyces sp. 8K308]|uniref:hypothetical protein n=1 Tax=Streptomyces sp. 8K308 TaxID=2530388 RepID=UPI00104CEF7C|nr:hypothetical protein [Streptomyces sp. 8K308]TDC20619.1 hypothetical protein E1265_21350 [Streptomyces sp. 8K308]